MHLINKKNNNRSIMGAFVATLFALAFIGTSTMGAAPAAATIAAATSTTMPQPVTATTDNQSVNVLISWEPTDIQLGEDTEFTLNFQDPASGDSIPHVNYNFEIIDQDGAPVESITDLQTHSGSDEQTATFDTPGSFNLVVTIIGTGIDPPFETTQSGTAQTIIPVGQQLPGAVDANITTTAASTTEEAAAATAALTTTSNTTASSSGIELSPQPVYQRRPSTTGVTPVNQTYIHSTFSSNGTLTLPNTTETINTTSNGSALTSLTTQYAITKETIISQK
jgi:hypothetical protein